MKEQTMPSTKLDVSNGIPASAVRPLYAGVGVTDRVVEVLREYVSDVAKRVTEVQKSVADLHVEELTKTVGKDAQARRVVVEKRVSELQTEALAIPTKLQKLLEEQVATAGDTYEDLIKRGETLVLRVRRQPATQAAVADAKTTTAKAKTTATQVKNTATQAKTTAKRTASTAQKSATGTAAQVKKSPAKSSAKATATSARKTASKAAGAAVESAEKIGD
jgi:hypothetical protein